MPVAVELPESVASKSYMPANTRKRSCSTAFHAKLERSRQSARECRARKNLRYQYLEELVLSREKAVCALREELDTMKHWCVMVDHGEIPAQAITAANNEQQQRNKKLRCAADSSTDNASHAGACQLSFKPEVELRQQFTENELEQNVISTDVQWPAISYSPLETLIDCPIVATVFDVDQCLENWADIPLI